MNTETEQDSNNELDDLQRALTAPPKLHLGKIPHDMELAMSMEGWQVYTRKNPERARVSIKIVRTIPARKGNFWLLFDFDKEEFLPHPDLITLATRYPREYAWLLGFLIEPDEREFTVHTRI